MRLEQIYIVILSLLSTTFFAQDGYFAQHDKAQQLFNPAYTSFNRDFGTNLLVRTQWGNTDGNSLKSFVFVDGKLKRLKSYIGLDVNHDLLNSGNTQKLELNLRYAYQHDLSRKTKIRAGVGLGYGNISHKGSSYVFGDQIGLDGVNSSSTQEDLGTLEQKSFFEMNIGTVLFTEKGFEFAIGARHINFPLLSKNETVTNRIKPFITTKIANKWQVAGSVYRPNSKIVYLIPSLVWMNQAQYNLIQLGADVLIEKVMLGVFFRGWPSKLESEYNRGSSLTLRAALNTETFQMGYAYDLVLSSNMTNANSHEISIGYYLSELKTNGPRRRSRF